MIIRRIVKEHEREKRCGHTMMLDVRGNVLMMWVRTLQFWNIRMRLGIVPVQLLIALPDLVTVPVNDSRQPLVQCPLSNNQPDAAIKEQFPGYPCQCCSSPHKSYRRAVDRWKLFWQAVQE
jgi:hypothetical protein